MPASAVTPAPVAYTNVAAAKTSVVDRGRQGAPSGAVDPGRTSLARSLILF